MGLNFLNITASQMVVEVADTGKQYSFVGFHTLTIENPQSTHIIRGSDGLSQEGVEYSEGMSAPIVVTCGLITTQNFYPAFKSFYEKKSRLNLNIVDRIDGRILAFKKSILQKLPSQTTIDESEESVKINFIFETFTMIADYKGGEDF
jgi:hypothetical protein